MIKGNVVVSIYMNPKQHYVWSIHTPNEIITTLRQYTTTASARIGAVRWGKNHGYDVRWNGKKMNSRGLTIKEE